jgi:hypothetical protein
LNNLGVNRSKNLVYSHELKYTEAISYRTRYPYRTSDSGRALRQRAGVLSAESCSRNEHTEK